jgi:hypothetical protein
MFALFVLHSHYKYATMTSILVQCILQWPIKQMHTLIQNSNKIDKILFLFKAFTIMVFI